MVGGKTGTAEKVVNGRYSDTKRLEFVPGRLPDRRSAICRAGGARRAAGGERAVAALRRAPTRRRRSARSSAARRRCSGSSRARTMGSQPCWCRIEPAADDEMRRMKRTTGRPAVSMHLGDLAVAAGLTLPDGRRGDRHRRACRPTAARSGRAFCSRRCRAARPTARASPATPSAAARSRCWPAPTRALDLPAAVPVLARRRSAPGAGADRGALLSAPAGPSGRRHRHQRQDLGRRLRPPDLRRRRQRGGEPRHARRRQPAGAANTAA